MSKVTKFNGEGGTSEGLYLHKYSGGGIDQFSFPSGDPHLHIGDTFSMNVRVELKAVVSDRTNEGPREILQFRVVDSAPPKFVARADGQDPNQTSIDDVEDRDGGTYGDYTPPPFDPAQKDGLDPEAADDTDDGRPNDNPFKVVQP
ncbi:hypothetical protein L5G28_07520 [Gordonia sp. HY285]|uniref:hypothetical protein n=1 Tax=Gordonia liuliyuniae TaxID=2911517 RepID=UPI001F2EDF53|nr:hypothetical protein [Gordonia liuliyuniae]MCF8610009.1 hypothetical protein [Gordonia liuliyuniae]